MLQIRQLHKTYADGTVALANINWTARAGLVGLLGPNGAGKSSLLRTIATLQSADSGQIDVAGIDVLQTPELLRAVLGYLPQDFGVYPYLSCYALLEHIAILKGLHDKASRRAQLQQLLELTHLHAVAHKTVAQFSGGMRQRFGIAQALLGNPRLLLLDEPTAGLDPQERNQFNQVLADISHDRLVVLSSHMVDDIEQLCPQVAIMQQGRIVRAGDTHQLITPLDGCIWQAHQAEALPLPPDAVLLERRFWRGIAQQRVYATRCPGPSYAPVTASLADLYVLTLHEEAV